MHREPLHVSIADVSSTAEHPVQSSPSTGFPSAHCSHDVLLRGIVLRIVDC